MNIKISTFKSMLHKGEAFTASNQEFISDIEGKLGASLTLSELDDYDCDLKLIFIESGGSEGLFLKNYDKLKEPYYILTSGNNNSLAASLEILTYLNNNNKKGEIIHGDVEYIVKRIKELVEFETFKHKLASTRLGVVGKPSDWLISSIPSYDKLKEKLGVELVDINIKDVEAEFNKINFLEINRELKEFDFNELYKAKRIYQAFSNVVKKNKLDGFTVRCFDLLTSLKSTGCLGLALLNDEGIISTCEGDVMAMVSMVIAHIVSGGYVFQANPSRIDVNTNQIVFAHCTIPTKMVKDYKFDTHFESLTGVAIKGYLHEEDVTVLRLSSDLQSYFVEEGKILKNLESNNLCRTQIEVKFDNDISNILKHPCGNHHIIFYGRWKSVIEKLLKELL